MKKIILALALLLTVGLTSAYNVSSFDSSQMNDYESMINERTAGAPPLFSSLVGNQTINIIIEDNGENTTAGAKLEGLTLTEIQSSKYEDPTIEIVTDQQTVESIGESETPLDTAIQEFNDGDIEYRAEGFWNKLKLSMVEPFLTG